MMVADKFAAVLRVRRAHAAVPARIAADQSSVAGHILARQDKQQTNKPTGPLLPTKIYFDEIYWH